MTAAGKTLVFTSAGDHSAVERWTAESGRGFDLCVVYYGDRPETPELELAADFLYRRKGSKFQNLHWLGINQPDLLQSYEAIFVLDDDIVIDSSGIEMLFDIRRSFDLWMLQPSFLPSGRISHRITKVQPTRRLRFTSFVEVACPLVRTDKLLTFLEVYDPRLVGWGVDYWLSSLLNDEGKRRIAIVDEVPCVNPHHEQSKSGSRQIDTLQPAAEREAVWRLVAAERGLPPQGLPLIEFGAVRRPWKACAKPLIAFLGATVVGLVHRSRKKLAGKLRSMTAALRAVSPTS